MVSDYQGYELSGACAETAELYQQAISQFNLYRGDPVALLDQVLAQAPDFVMAHLLKAYLYVMATEPAATTAAAGFVAQARILPANDRETSHIAVLSQLLAGNWTAAAQQMDQHNVAYPLDLLGLQCGHLIDFYRASNRSLRDRLARVIPQWSAQLPGYSVLLGMYAFGLEECGDYRRAEATGRQALALEPLDCWAHHAVAHVMEMEGRAEDGVGWMITRQASWAASDNFFQVHNWWHLALYRLELGQTDAALELYDGPVRQGNSEMALDMVDASALLWRLALSGVELSSRWQSLAQQWDQHADGQLYPFNDWHAVMAYLGAGRTADVERLIRDWKQPTHLKTEVADWARTTGLPLVEGLYAFWQGDYAQAARLLQGARYIVNRFGGSHAQRDLIDWTLMEAAVRGGLTELGRSLANERLALKPHSVLNRQFLQRAEGSANT